MNRRKLLVAGACALVAAVVLYVSFFRASDEEKIRQTLNELARTIAVKEGDNILSRTARMRSKLKDLVEDDVSVNVAEVGVDVRGRPAFEDNAAKVGLLYSQADCAITNVTIKIDPQATLAQVDALALVTSNRGGERRADKRDVHFLLRKDGIWKVSSIDVAAKKPEE